MPFSELPLRLQDAAIESFRDSGKCWDDDCELLQEDLAEILGYEFGLTVWYAWDQYNCVEFEVDNFDLDEVLKHARDDEETVKEFGTCYFKPEAKELQVLLAEVVMLELVLGVDFNAGYRLKEDRNGYGRVEWQWERDDGPKYYPTETPGSSEYQAAKQLFNRIDEALKDYYEAACRRLRKCIEDDEEWHSSDEYIQELLEGNDCWEFDEEGDLV